jgi:transposase
VPANLQKAKDRKREIKALIDELARLDLEKMSLTDKDASFMKSHGRFQLSYNAQCATENQIILAYDVNDQKEDSDQLVSMIVKAEQLAAEVKGQIDFPLAEVQVVADSGYDSGKNLHHLEQRKIDGYIASQDQRAHCKEKQGKNKQLSKAQFVYHSDGDYYQCPAGHKVILRKQQFNERKGYRFLVKTYRAENCHSCSLQKQCVRSKTGYRTICQNPEYERMRQKIDAKLSSEQGKALMRHRATDIEPVFGHIKQTIMKNGSFLLRGTAKVNGEFGLICLVHNLKKIANHLKAKKDEVKPLHMAKFRLRPA